jgi:hypothetical protein
MPSLKKVSNMTPGSFASKLLATFTESPLTKSIKRRRSKMRRLLSKKRRTRTRSRRMSASRKNQSQIITEFRRLGKPLTTIGSLITSNRRTRRRSRRK